MDFPSRNNICHAINHLADVCQQVENECDCRKTCDKNNDCYIKLSMWALLKIMRVKDAIDS